MRLPPFALERYFARHEFAVAYLLCSSDCESMSIQELLALEPGAQEGFLGHRLGYTESSGSPSLRRDISRLYGGIDPERILVHAGAEEAIFLFMHATLERGDHVIVQRPCYQSLFEVAAGIGCEVTAWQAREENGWSPDLGELKTLMRPGTKVIIFNTPHNPTGFHMRIEQFRELVRLADAKGITLFSDEVYRGLERTESERLPAACELSERAVSLGVMSKTYGFAGLRVGWIATRDEAVRARMASMKDYTTICSSAPSEFLAELALRHGETIAARNRAIISANLALLDAFFDRHADSFSWRHPRAGPIAFPRLLRGEVETFCDQLAQAKSVLLLPGTVYDDQGNHFRIGFGRKNMPQALQRLEEYMESGLTPTQGPGPRRPRGTHP
jgi:aspartate/methionine/tyrosine aminotransferase